MNSIRVNGPALAFQEWEGETRSLSTCCEPACVLSEVAFVSAPVLFESTGLPAPHTVHASEGEALVLFRRTSETLQVGSRPLRYRDYHHKVRRMDVLICSAYVNYL